MPKLSARHISRESKARGLIIISWKSSCVVTRVQHDPADLELLFVIRCVHRIGNRSLRMVESFSNFLQSIQHRMMINECNHHDHSRGKLVGRLRNTNGGMCEN